MENLAYDPGANHVLDKSLYDAVDLSNVPQHIAIIMDGNGRWGKKFGLSRVIGHREGVETVRVVVETSLDLGLKFLSLFAFSTDNIFRPLGEVSSLFGLFEEILDAEAQKLHERNIRLIVSGDVSILPACLKQKFTDASALMENNTGMVLNIALNYSGRQEIIDAVKRIIDAVADGSLKRDELSEEFFRRFLYYPDLPYPDLLIRTSGEYRISNFLLWQSAYSEMWFTNSLWPEFSQREYVQAIVDYQARERRFGKIDS